MKKELAWLHLPFEVLFHLKTTELAYEKDHSEKNREKYEGAIQIGFLITNKEFSLEDTQKAIEDIREYYPDFWPVKTS